MQHLMSSLYALLYYTQLEFYGGGGADKFFLINCILFQFSKVSFIVIEQQCTMMMITIDCLHTDVLRALEQERQIRAGSLASKVRRTVVIPKRRKGKFGFTVQSYVFERLKYNTVESITYVDHVALDSPAFDAGLRSGAKRKILKLRCDIGCERGRCEKFLPSRIGCSNKQQQIGSHGGAFRQPRPQDRPVQQVDKIVEPAGRQRIRTESTRNSRDAPVEKTASVDGRSDFGIFQRQLSNVRLGQAVAMRGFSTEASSDEGSSSFVRRGSDRQPSSTESQCCTVDFGSSYTEQSPSLCLDFHPKWSSERASYYSNASVDISSENSEESTHL
ncbi:conserved hypothetical protein [Trichinella spiralis]|uniref:hypothetical protein n=1 Tax=Trichinella spiralis TaxID=6334 RepID=UPI0001EFE516|nr:conserved hypothetical protein [Trichinella spiralis]